MPDRAHPQQPANRFERRRAQTRHALIVAAQRVLAEQGTSEVSIQQIAERADVGFGSFYNHFRTKAELFEAAVVDALEEYGKLIDSITDGLDDPAEVFAVSVRLTFRLADTHPELTRVLRFGGLPYIHEDFGLGPRALRDIEKGNASGRFRVASPLVALSAVGGSLLGLLQLKSSPQSGPALAGADEEMAELILRMLGLTPEDAHEVARRPLPGTNV
ncbi:helix-turn-helix domain-containing protein [Streptomyces sp. NPDC051920]|uniref:TetR/AcrR family transcriptional regulator n=1 Tax=Streptomyces sp. NPDC051920 TaxID=3155523 RepID=UPI00343517C8